MAFNAKKNNKSNWYKKNEENDVIELFVWAGGFGLSSIDTESLQALAVTRFGGAPSKVIECNNPWKSPNGNLPFFKHGEKIFYTANDLANHLRAVNYSCDYGLSPKQCADVVAFGEYIADALNPALQYYCWLHNQNFEHIIRPFYGSRLPWLYKMWYPDRRMQAKARDLITTLYPDAANHHDVCEPYLLQRAQVCIQLLSSKLGTNDFFMLQKTPSSIDAIVYSYLAPFLKVPFSSCPVREYILSTPNLERYVARITTRYLTSGIGGQGDVDQGSASSSRTSVGPQGDSTAPVSDNSTSHKLLTFIVGIGAMVFYAYRIGMIHLPGQKQIRSEEQYNPADEEDEDDEY